MTTNVRPRQAGYPLITAVTEPSGTSVDKDTFDRIAAALIKEDETDFKLLKDGEQGLETAWDFDRWRVTAAEEGGQYFVAEGSLATTDDLEFSVVTVLSGYPDEEAAVLDAKRLLVRRMIKDPELRGVLGWREDVVILTRGHLWIIARVHRTGKIELSYTERPMEAYAEWFQKCDNLAGEILSYRLDIEEEGTLPFGRTRDVAAAFIYREAAEMVLEQAKLMLTTNLKLITEGSTKSGKRLSLGPLASNTYTDLGTMIRARDRKIHVQD